MNLLFIHGNFPGQFLKLAPFLVRQLGGVAVFLSESDNPQNIKLDGVELVTFQPHRKPSDGIHRYLYPSENASVACGCCMFRSFGLAANRAHRF